MEIGFALLLMLLVLVWQVVLPRILSSREDLPESATVPSGQAELCDGNCFRVPLAAPNHPFLRIWFEQKNRPPDAPRFWSSLGTVSVLHRDETGILVHVIVSWLPRTLLAFVYVVDPSTYRPHLLRVPPAMQRARQAVAWTFQMDEADWYPVTQA